MTTPGSHKISFNALKNLNKPGRPQPWKITDLFTDKSEKEILDYLAQFFNRISSEFDDLAVHDIPETFNHEVGFISGGKIIERIRKMKRPKSSVPGDVPPHLLLIESFK